ncbi:hypothetical protein CRD36_17240 [Paremcibacter congregatus]|uniref:Uncharacterized protein n=2 Tax=Paremcibacter congregatus TaxID=2043170 RepID=A0A2G4YMH3_9PROT|nr:hypothetical protein CRD36_17240 [Paremcibacter congregatus]QDE29290.1 hypothetical protein FIV45_13545 [Paremcibacter congregatus]
MTLTTIRQDLEKLSGEMLTLIQKYNLDATSSLDIISTARQKITDPKDYVRFLELSLEGRILGEAATALEEATVKDD